MNHAVKSPDIRMNRHMYKGYETPDTPAENDAHPPEQWRKFTSQGLRIAIVRGFQAKQLLCDQQDMVR